MYKFSKDALERFFTYPIETFFFLSFSLSEEGLKFIEGKTNEEKLGKLE